MQTFFQGPFDNSLWTDKNWQQRSVMILVPHADDETNLTGATICNLKEHGIRVRLVYYTNSDDTGENLTRLREALAAGQVLGLPPEDVIFLGYANNFSPSGTPHFYNREDDYVNVSSTGRRETTSLPEHPEFCFQEYGCHHLYTKANLRADTAAVILKYHPELILAVDFDRHQDHRAFSLIFEEALATILQTPGSTYTPEVYKGFAYNGSYLGVRDFYRELNLAGEKPASGSFSNDLRFETDLPPYDWNQRLRLPVPADCLSRTMLSNKIYRSLRAHFSQGIIHNAKRVINSDQIFWRRRTDSRSYQAKVTVSSGQGACLQDFKLVDCPDIMAKPASFTGTWLPDSQDSLPTVRLTFAQPLKIQSVVLYGNADPDSRIDQVRLLTSSGQSQTCGALRPGAKATVIPWPKNKTSPACTWLEIQLLQRHGSLAGLNEIEVYDRPLSTLQPFIKAMVKDVFAYDYWVTPAEAKLDFEVYVHGLERPQFSWQALNQGDFQLTGSHLELGKNFTQAQIQVSVQGRPEIWDKFVIRRKSRLQLAALKAAQAVDIIEHRCEHIAKTKYVQWFQS